MTAPDDATRGRTARPPTPRAPDPTRDVADVEERRSFRRAMGIGLFVWPGFAFVDQYLGRVPFPGAPLVLCFLLRIVGELAIGSMYLLSFRPSITRTQLKAANAAVCSTAAVLIAVMGTYFGGLTGPYLHGTTLVMLVLALAVPSPWYDTLWYAAACSLAYPVTVLALAPFRADLRHELADPRRLYEFSGHYTILLGAVVIAAVTGHANWNARQELRKARRLGRYRLEARIGEGGMNEVWLAFDPTLKRNVALKILRSGADTDPRRLAQFEREALALSQLRSPHTVRVYDFGSGDDGFSFIAMEFLPGKDAQALVGAEGPLDESRATTLIAEACRSLAEAHQAGIVHRDVKPANLFVTTDADGAELVKVLDFGIARQVHAEGDATRTESVRGTPAYMAPECWTGGVADARSDVYALGATLWFLLVGRSPFAGTPTEDLVRAHLVEPPAAPSVASGRALDPALDALVLRCLAKQPSERFVDAAALEDALGRLLP